MPQSPLGIEPGQFFSDAKSLAVRHCGATSWLC
ncbi:hypothetical protein XAP412_320134 [Xanthomonas phaseoli pv. phaseoli]|nr:hypothetical protein XAP412_320134 [Xanthomonas phaseoli pv. phaseoli]